MKNLNKLEQCQKNINEIEFIKSYPILYKLKISPLQVRLIELVLSYQFNNKNFYMTKSDIADVLFSTRNSIKDAISKLNKLGLVTSNQSHNINKRGSVSTLSVNVDKITEIIEKEQTPGDIAKKQIKKEDGKLLKEEEVIIKNEGSITTDSFIGSESNDSLQDSLYTEPDYVAPPLDMLEEINGINEVSTSVVTKDEYTGEIPLFETEEEKRVRQQREQQELMDRLLNS